MKEILMVLSFIPFFGYVQDGPGGVGNTNGTSNLVLWLDANRVSANNGATVAIWMDQSGNNFDFNNGNGAIYDLLSSNGYPALTFNGNSDYFQRPYTPELSTSEFTVITANNVTSSNTYKAVVSNRDDPAGSATAGFILYSLPNSNNWGFWTGRASGSWQATGNSLSTAGSWASQTIVYNNGVNGKNLSINQGLNATNTHTLTINPSRPYRVGAGANESTPNYYFQGDIGEIIQYNNVINSSQRIIINNYLSAKYGFNLTNDDLYNEDIVGNGNFDHDVAGIGRINTSDLHTDSQGTGIVRISNPSELGDNEFLFWGHDNGLQQATNMTDVPVGVQARFERIWRASEVNLLLTPVDVGAIDIRFDLAGLGAVIASDLRLMVDSDNDGTFNDETAIGGATDIGGNVYEFSGITEIENNLRFTLGTINSGQTPLPIELTNFCVNVVDDRYVGITWQTYSETNNDYFTIERSMDLEDWEIIKVVQGAGNSIGILNYESIDENPFSDVSYYRLRQTDFNQQFSHSEIRTIYIGKPQNNKIDGFPNPTQDEILLHGIDQKKEQLQIFNFACQDVTFLVPVKYISTEECLLDLSDLASGIYLIRTKSSLLRVSKH
ncbi:MAG: hypothetical protein HRT58_21375 [Crocinitomicaceae bacterium]|nr:T9SS type A sorting domain-containing protein [Flavobacteriales bacterium]NQZ38225.1 hypothetical protein [Crocinitomicaceae bacterium]